jgi:hypothetical protein
MKRYFAEQRRLKLGQEQHESCLVIARREAPGLVVPTATLYKHLRRCNGDLEAAIERYLKPPNNARPILWEGQSFATRREFTAHLAGVLHRSVSSVTDQLCRHKWNV